MNTTANPIVELRAELRSAASRRVASARRRRRLVVLAVVILAGVTTSLSIAGNGWLIGEPAPPPVVSDFKAYTPQLGFHPEPGKAVFVAQDGAIKLYATTNREGTYCLVVDEPWKPPSAGDGGTCVPKRSATSSITASVIGISAASKDGEATFVIAGRVDSAKARTIRFEDTNGASVERPIGSGGFYVAALHGKLPIPVVGPHGVKCPAKGWKPTFTALGADGEKLLSSTVPLMESRMCVSTFFGS